MKTNATFEARSGRDCSHGRVRFASWKSVPLRAGFSLVDLLVLVVLLGLLGGWIAHAHTGERGRIARCAGNLEALGRAMQSFDNEHNDGLPPAAIDLEKTRIGWYADLFPYLDPKWAQAVSEYDKQQHWWVLQPWFLCPSDPGKRGGHPCSYAMPAHAMTSENWPPSSANATGIGLWWDETTVSALLGSDMVTKAEQDPEVLPRLKLSVLPDPANTSLLTELIARDNTLNNITNTRVEGVEEQQALYKGNLKRFHFGRFNYLMADGHVELLTGLQTGGGGDAPAGIWTIKTGD